MLARAERLHREVFRPSALPAWEPPSDIIETEHEVLVFVALPGVEVDRIQAIIEDGYLIIEGARTLPPQLRTAIIHRLELPQGRFQRRLPLPSGRFSSVQRAMVDGCLVIKLEKLDHAR